MGLMAVRPGGQVRNVNADALGLFDALRSLQLPASDYAVFGSGPLIVRGIIEPTSDLDVLSRGAAWAKAKTLGDRILLPEHAVEVVSLLEGAITIGTRWAIGEIDTDELIHSAEIIEGLPFVRMEHVVRYKEIAARPKDLAHLRLLNAALPGEERTRD